MTDIIFTVLSVLGIIILSLVIIIIICLFFKVKLFIAYDKKFIVKLKFLFFSINLIPQKNDKNKSEKNKQKQKKTEKSKKDKNENDNAEKQQTESKKRGIFEYLEITKIIITRFIKKIFFETIDIYIKAASSDAARTAMFYGELNAAIYPIIGFINSNKEVRNLKVIIEPDFSTDKAEYRINLIMYTRLVYALHSIILVLKYF